MKDDIGHNYKIYNEPIRNAKRGCQKKTLAKEAKCAIQNKGARKASGRNRRMYEKPWTFSPDTDSQLNNSNIWRVAKYLVHPLRE